MPSNPLDALSRRERQIMEIIYARRRVSAVEVQELLGGDAPGYSAVRSALALLEKKGLVTHSREGLKYIFVPCIPGEHARESVLRGVVKTFFQSSVLETVQTLLSDRDLKLSKREIAEIEALVEAKKKEERKK